MNSGKTHRIMAVGAPSLIMIFVTLCLACFAALTLSSAEAEARLAEKAAQSAAGYYAADTRLQERIAALDAELKECGAESGEFRKRAESLGGEWNEDFSALTMEEPAGGSVKLTAEIVFSGSRYEIAEYRTALAEEPEYNAGYLNIWSGE